MVRKIVLDEHVGKVDASIYAQSNQTCECLYWLTDAEVYILLSHLLPFAYWDTRYVYPVDREYWNTAPDDEFKAYQLVVNALVVKLTGGDDTMGCNAQIAAGLQAIADAMRSSGGGSNGGGCGSGPSRVINCLSEYTDDQLLDTPPADVDPHGGQPPDGFDTMAEYLTYKCQAAHAVLDALKGFALGLQGFAVMQLTINTVGPVVAALLSGLGVITIAFPPGAAVALVAAIVAVGVLSSFVFVAGGAFAQYLDDHRAELTCSLYLSGSASDAIGAIADATEDFIQTYEWGGLGAGEAFGAIMAQFQNNGLVKPLFQLTADLAYPGAECTCGGSVCQHSVFDFADTLFPWEDFGDGSGIWFEGAARYTGGGAYGQQQGFMWEFNTVSAGDGNSIRVNIDGISAQAPYTIYVQCFYQGSGVQGVYNAWTGTTGPAEILLDIPQGTVFDEIRIYGDGWVNLAVFDVDNVDACISDVTM